MRVTASHIVEWANTHAKEAQNELPRLVRRLCFLAGSTRQLAFPAGNSTYIPGWDGRLFSDQGNAWVPVAASCWEVGCDQQIGSKANGDYRKRTSETEVAERVKTTFVFVTPRRWSRKSSWIKTQRKQAEWADVRAYDADDLEQWLEQSPAVALRFAEELGLLGQGVKVSIATGDSGRSNATQPSRWMLFSRIALRHATDCWNEPGRRDRNAASL